MMKHDQYDRRTDGRSRGGETEMAVKARAFILTLVMIGSVLTAGVAFVGSAAADSAAGPIQLEAEHDEVITGDDLNSIEVTIKNAVAGEKYEYRLYSPNGTFIMGGESSDDTFTVTALFATEGVYRVVVINDDGSRTGTTFIVCHYEVTIHPNAVTVGDEEITVTGKMVDEESNPVAGEVVEMNDLDPKRENSRATTDADGEFTFTIIPDEVGSYAIYDPETLGTALGYRDDTGRLKLEYTAFEVQPMELGVRVDRTALLAGLEERVAITVMRDGDPVIGNDLKNLVFEITQKGVGVASGGTFTDDWDDNGPNAGDLWVDTYRVNIDADQSVDAPVVVRVYKPLPNPKADNPRLVGIQNITVLSPEIDVTPSSPLTKGVRRNVTITVDDPRTGDPLPEDDVELKFAVPSGANGVDVVEFRSSETNVLQTNGVSGASGTAVELTEGEFAVIREQSSDRNLRFDVNVTMFAFDDSSASDSVTLDVLARADDDDGAPPESAPYDLLGGARSVVFERIDGDADPDQIPVAGESVILVTTRTAAGDPLNRGVDLDGARINDQIQNSVGGVLESTEGFTGDDGRIAFSVNPDRTDTILLFVDYDNELVGGDASPPDRVVTDKVEVVAHEAPTPDNDQEQENEEEEEEEEEETKHGEEEQKENGEHGEDGEHEGESNYGLSPGGMQSFAVFEFLLSGLRFLALGGLNILPL